MDFHALLQGIFPTQELNPRLYCLLHCQVGSLSLAPPAAAAAKSLQSCPTLCDPIDGSPPGSSIHGIFQARLLEWSATWEAPKRVCESHSVVSDSLRPHRRQPTRLPRSWDSPGKNPGVGCHFLLQCMKVKSESEVAQSCPTPWTTAYQAPPSMGFSRQEYWSGAPPGQPPKEYVKVTQSCPTLCDPIDGSPPGSSIHGIFQARVLEWSTTWEAPKRVRESHSVVSDSLRPHGLSMEFSRPKYWVAFPFSRRSFQPRDQTQVSHIAGGFFTS